MLKTDFFNFSPISVVDFLDGVEICCVISYVQPPQNRIYDLGLAIVFEVTNLVPTFHPFPELVLYPILDLLQPPLVDIQKAGKDPILIDRVHRQNKRNGIGNESPFDGMLL